MVKKQFICKRCGKKFIVEVFEEGEAKEKRLRGAPVRCPECGGDVERA
jgi:DNA-directed RNA polymerase subunit RPC12/RpoP